MKENTFGDSNAAIKLYQAVQDNNKKKKRVGRLLTNFSFALNEIKRIDYNSSIELGGLLYSSTKDKCEQFPEEYRNYVRGSVKERYRKWLNHMKIIKKVYHE